VDTTAIRTRDLTKHFGSVAALESLPQASPPP